MDKMYPIFEHELSTSTIPFENIFEHEPFKGYLFEEFLLAELKPCFWLYCEQYYSQKEYEKMLGYERKLDEERAIPSKGNISIAASSYFPSENTIKLREIEEGFFIKKTKKTLEPKFFCPDILKTPTVLILDKISETFDFIKKPDFDNQKLEFYVKIVANHLKEISKADLRESIIEHLIDDILKDNGAYFENWKNNKFEFDNLLKMNFPVSQESFNFDGILEMLKYDWTEKVRPIFEKCLIELSRDKRFKKAISKEFATVALIFKSTGWIKGKWPEWLEIFSISFSRIRSTYKMNHVEKDADLMKIKYGCLNDLPIK